LEQLTYLLGSVSLVKKQVQRAHRQWVEQALENGLASRDDRWSESIAVGSMDFVEKIKTELGMKAMHRDFEPAGEAYALREPAEAYGRNFGGKPSF
jgi:putative transposase